MYAVYRVVEILVSEVINLELIDIYSHAKHTQTHEVLFTTTTNEYKKKKHIIQEYSTCITDQAANR